MLQDGMGYLKTVIDLTKALIEIEKNKNGASLTSSKIENLGEFNSIYETEIIKTLIFQITGIKFETNPNKKTNYDFIIFNMLSNSYKKTRAHNFPIIDAIKHHILYIKNTKCY